MQSVNYAGFWRRFAANFIDGLVLAVVSFPINIIVGFIKAALTPAVTDTTASLATFSMASLVGVIGSVILYAIEIAYFVYFIGSKGQTLGKMAMKIKVVKVGTNEAPGYIKAFLRDIIGKILSSIVFCLGYLWMLWDSKKQTWHDKIAGTVVIRV